jgi:hypothetical protein
MGKETNMSENVNELEKTENLKTVRWLFGEYTKEDLMKMLQQHGR